jgi:hypothetical protein
MVTCPRCKASVADSAVFCGECGAGLRAEAPPSLFDLPRQGAGRGARVALVLGLDAVLAGAGIAMIVAYLHAREAAARPHPGQTPAAEVATAAEPTPPEVQVQTPRVVGQRPSAPSDRDDRPGKPPSPPPSTKPPAGTPDGKPGTPDVPTIPGLGLGRPDAAVPVVTPPPPPPPGGTEPDAAVVDTPDTPPPPPGGEPDAALVDTPPDGETTVDEQALAEGVQATVQQHMGQVQRCWVNVAKTGSEPVGLVEIEFAVAPTGDARDIRVVKNETGSDPLGECIVALVGRWQFPQHGGDPVVFVWPFLFKSTK